MSEDLDILYIHITTSLHKKISKRNLADVHRDESMNALADKAHKQHTVICTLRPHYSTTIPT